MNQGMRTIVTLLCTGCAVAAFGATARGLDTPAPEALPALIHTVEPAVDDSTLVRAAKMTVAARLRASSEHPANETVNDVYMQSHRGGHFSQGSGALAPVGTARNGNSAADGTIYVAAPVPKGADASAIEAKRRNVQDERARANAEGEEPYGGNYGMEEDQAERRAAQTQDELQRLNRQASQPAKPTPPPQ